MDELGKMGIVGSHTECDPLLEELDALKQRRRALLREILTASRADRAIGMLVFVVGILALLASVPRIWIEGGERIIGVILGVVMLGVGLHMCWRPLPKGALYQKALALEAEIARVSGWLAERGNGTDSH